MHRPISRDMGAHWMSEPSSAARVLDASRSGAFDLVGRSSMTKWSSGYSALSPVASV